MRRSDEGAEKEHYTMTLYHLQFHRSTLAVHLGLSLLSWPRSLWSPLCWPIWAYLLYTYTLRKNEMANWRLNWIEFRTESSYRCWIGELDHDPLPEPVKCTRKYACNTHRLQHGIRFFPLHTRRNFDLVEYEDALSSIPNRCELASSLFIITLALSFFESGFFDSSSALQ